MTYIIWRACERWGIEPWKYHELDAERKRRLIAYEWVRLQEGTTI